nr:xanthine dehydrogenase family protein molybdopterin-binding subunit [Gammaproteobacteria bacterium]
MSANQYGIGDSPKRREDARLLQGLGSYHGDIVPADSSFAVFVRSTHAHAQLLSIDVSSAATLSGVHEVLVGTDACEAGIKPLPPHAEENPHNGERYRFQPQPVLALGRVRYVGEPIAVVIAETEALAHRAADLITVEYSPLPVITTVTAAKAADAVLISDEVPGNTCLDWDFGDAAATDKAFQNAAYVVELDVDN